MEDHKITSLSTDEDQIEARRIANLCESAYSSFCSSGGGSTLDTHLDNCLQHVADEDANCFVRQVVYGVTRYRRFLDCFLDSFFHHNRGTALRADAVKYRVLTYLAAFRLQELTFPTFRLLLEAQDAQKVLLLLQYLFNGSRLQQTCREDWLQVYDKEFVDGTIAGLLSWQAEVDPLLAKLRAQVYFTQQQEQQQEASSSSSSGRAGSSPARCRKPAPTVPQEFKLSQPCPKPLPQPEPVPPAVKPKPPPKFQPGPTKEQLAIEAARAAHRQAAAARQADPRFQPFKLRVLERPMHSDAVRAELEAKLAAELAARPQARPAPPPPTAEVRLNAAAVLREDALYKRKQAAEAAALQKYEAELRDTAAFDRWQAALREADAAQQAERVEQLRSEMSAAAGAAAQAKAELLAAKAATTNAEKAARAAREEERQRAWQQQQEANAQRAAEVAADRAKAKQAQEEALIERRLAAQQVRQQAQEEARQRSEQAAAEAAERRHIIAQLRGLEKAARARNNGLGGASRGKVFDPTAVPEHGINNTMSLAELRVRLEAAKQRQLEEEARARARILEARQAHQASLSSKVTQLAAIRRLASAQAQLVKAAAQAQRARTADAVLQRTEANALALSDCIEAKHAAAAAEAARVAAQERRLKFEQLQLAAGESVVEAKRFRELRDGKRRDCEHRQVTSLQQAQIDDVNAAKLAAARQHVIGLRQQQHTSLQRQYDKQLASAAQQASLQSTALLSSKQRAAARRRQQEEAQRTQHATAAYRPFSGGGHTTMQARLQALAAGQEL
ncbi:hypothetical protein OEZ85_007232 [Tetradesmus obliquus]|uniref:PCI domain-containing protein n=1 Tax=Tetradesmus obliquus TaxID=3088 RepID=A0ABY8TZK3_TETOB|nr:hypothetical protein OEZ85_007232 [Tetradesmus obliquus]